MSEYIGLTALKEALGLTGAASDTVDDGLLQSCIFRASAIVDGYLTQIRPGYVGFAAGSNSHEAVGSNTRTYDGNGDDFLWIDDATSVASVTVDGTSITSTAYTTWPYNETPKRAIRYIRPATSTYGLLQDHWSVGTANVSVVGYFGLDYVPSDVEQAALAVALLIYRRIQGGEIEPTYSGVLALGRDPEMDGILVALWPRWGVPFVGGA